MPLSSPSQPNNTGSIKLSFHGANQAVTGSCHLLEAGGLRIVVDCGLHQGGRDADERNAAPFGFDPSSVDVLVLTHAHLDHCGRLPLLVKRGFKGRIVCTEATRELARLVLLDAAHLQEEEAQYQQRKLQRRGENRDAPVLYSVVDALRSFDCFAPGLAYGEAHALNNSVSVTLHNAGHILGAASAEFQIQTEQGARRILLSGDIGPQHPALLLPPKPPGQCDVVVMETTYGDRLHRPLQPSIDELYQVIEETWHRGGNVVIPTFALERAQELLNVLRMGVEQHNIPRGMQIFLDSPMAISATEIFKRYADQFCEPVQAMLTRGEDPFSWSGVHNLRESSQSQALNQIKSGAIILAGAGMCNGGRVRHHLRHNLWRPACAVVFVGFAAQGTLARRIIDGARTVHLFGEEIPVAAQVHTINGFSAHADQADLLTWHAATGKPMDTVLVHGESAAMNALAERLPNTTVHRPEQGDELRI
ncbi:MBL fold metallo-hydrolase [Limnobacter humi]|uniref:MBL fold metallo-hydrolase n=1 Tax=Limnobacter humi TaxID=1778671 RepID=A0ABT1WF61_9BURK|nr:MBL fold metallo-hydrolase [Limnobacter humi]MCQ8896158.1 MBL fold metallo-hydrolase [Limnobacter humi]